MQRYFPNVARQMNCNCPVVRVFFFHSFCFSLPPSLLVSFIAISHTTCPNDLAIGRSMWNYRVQFRNVTCLRIWESRVWKSLEHVFGIGRLHYKNIKIFFRKIGIENIVIIVHEQEKMLEWVSFVSRLLISKIISSNRWTLAQIFSKKE